MGFSNMMSMIGGGGTPGVSDPSDNMDHGGGVAEPAAAHRDMNFGERLGSMAQSFSPVALPGVPQQGMAPQADLIGMNAKPSGGGGGLSMLLKLIGV